jgi:outer membrane protein OmpA-like peptidoglycan-associated protein
MNPILKKTTAIAAVALLAGCEGQVSGDITSSSYGSATTINLLSQAESLQGQLLADLQAEFRASAPDMINFEFDKADLEPEARMILDQQAEWIKANPAIKFRVYGHTDLVGSPGYNKALGLRRARAAVNYLVSRGVRKGQVEAVASFGETRPLVNTQEPERLNRRTVTEVFGLDRRVTGYLFDGKKANEIYTQGTAPEGYLSGDGGG